MKRYLIEVIHEMEDVVVGEETYQQRTGNKTYKVKFQTDSKAKPRGGDFLFLTTESDFKNPAVGTDLEGNLILEEGSATVKDKYDEMVSDIYAEMLSTFGTTNDISASAFAATYEAMKTRPANYVDTDLGLADEAAVIAYADTKLAAADAYGVYRLKRIAQYQAEKAIILGE